MIAKDKTLTYRSRTGALGEGGQILSLVASRCCLRLHQCQCQKRQHIDQHVLVHKITSASTSTPITRTPPPIIPIIWWWLVPFTSFLPTRIHIGLLSPRFFAWRWWRRSSVVIISWASSTSSALFRVSVFVSAPASSTRTTTPTSCSTSFPVWIGIFGVLWD